ncbi:hypothetical protein [Bacillus velezensis]|uniref:hypothetical protein n=2 Tax=Bacillus velezensis TaxID=492670 RepID=UPI00039B817E|nr:hypothetical protein [Bacillus velezensis]URD66520.1 hypothetical protein M8X21_21920 [Bacillus velezensis]WED88435.1 hypothetical protein PXG99_04915 [Bacillus velezensis]WFB53390.1 hypothetical protein P0M29_00435 [Bacillus velezensis]
MSTYQVDFNQFRGSMETTCDLYNLDNNTTLQTSLYRNTNSLCIEYKVIQRDDNSNSFAEYDTLARGYIEVPLTYNQFKKPVKKVYLNKIINALDSIINQYLIIEDTSQEINERVQMKVSVTKINEEDQSDFTNETSNSPIDQIRKERWDREYDEGVKYFFDKYGNKRIGDIIYIDTQQELEHLEHIDCDNVIRIFVDKEHENKIKAIVLKDINIIKEVDKTAVLKRGE